MSLLSANRISSATGWYGRGRPGPALRVALLGDSSAAGYGVERVEETTGAQLATGLSEQADRRVYLRSFAVVGAQSSDLRGQLDRCLPIEPDLAVILIGANNFGHLHWSAADTLLGIDAIVGALHRHLPRTHLVLLGVLPSIRNPYVDAATAAVNAALPTRYACDPLLTYVDAGSAVAPSGRPDPAAFLDGHLSPPDPPLHPTAQSQARIAALIEPAVAAAMGERVHR